MAMMVTTPPWCLRPPPDPPPLSFLGLMQHCSSSLKIMVTALPPPSQPRFPSDPPPNKHFPAETLSPVKPAEPPDPPDASVTTQILDLMFDLSRVSSKLSDGDAALVVTGDTIFIQRRLNHLIHINGYHHKKVLARNYFFNCERNNIQYIYIYWKSDSFHFI
ncbi:hypothetical protein Bca52824_094239 [Brassica carinata]|uniref:Uncharacterized protein n=1 Tax=Brassica carinata TaxID=52824 RepID=A0A8X7TJF4_BRACI|nr:hypothetical protein Bca52824_094239 [Brassica carinata]